MTLPLCAARQKIKRRFHFEAECARSRPPLKVPPRSSELNGIVKCANRIVRLECWRYYDGEPSCQTMNAALNCCLDYYDNDRLHRSLNILRGGAAITEVPRYNDRLHRSLNIRTPNQRTESACGPHPGLIAPPLNIRMPNQQTESLDVAA